MNKGELAHECLVTAGGESTIDQKLDRAELAAATVVASAVINFDEVILKR